MSHQGAHSSVRENGIDKLNKTNIMPVAMRKVRDINLNQEGL